MGGLVVSRQYGKITVRNIGKYTMNDTGVNQRVPKSLYRGGRPGIRVTRDAKTNNNLTIPHGQQSTTNRV
jgi:hypothetical protein